VIIVDFGALLDDSFNYTKTGFMNHWAKWLLLIVLPVLSLVVFLAIPFLPGKNIEILVGIIVAVLILAAILAMPLLGYMVRVYSGEKPAPAPSDWGTLFTNGLKLLVVEIIYALPVILLLIAAFLPLVSAFLSSGALNEDFAKMSETQVNLWMTSHPEFLSAAGLMIGLLILAVIAAIVITILSFIGTVRFARTGKISEAFNFSAILAQIARIGWLNYIFALIIIAIIGFIFGMITNVCSFIPVIGSLIGVLIVFFLYVPYIVFMSRYAALVYEQGEEPVPAVSSSEG